MSDEKQKNSSFDIGAIGQGAIGQVIGTGLGMLTAGWQDKRQLKMERKLGEMQVANSRALMDYQYQKQLDMWNATNYGAQVEHLKEAGLNPGLLYGKSGGGGMTIGGGMPTAGKGNAPVGGGEIQAAQGMALQLGMQKAQMDLIKAQTEKTKAEAEKTAGVDTTLGETQIRSLTQGIENQKAQYKLAEVETSLKELEKDFNEQTLSDRVWELKYNVNKAYKELQILTNQQVISEETYKETIKQIKLQTVASTLQNILTRAQTDKTYSDIQVNHKQIEVMSNQILQKWAEIGQGDKKLMIEKFKAEIDAQYPGLWNVGGKLVDQVVEGLGELLQAEEGRKPKMK